MSTLDFWFDYSCPYAYLASTQVEALAARTGAALGWKPMLLGGVFHAVGTPQNLSATVAPAKARHNGEDMMRWASFYGVPLVVPHGHPMRTVEALRATLATGIDPKVVHGFFDAYWRLGRDVSAPATIRDVVTAAGHDAAKVLATLDDHKDALRARTDEAVALGVFGAPTFVVNGRDLYWGQDRLPLVERALGASASEPARRENGAKKARTLDLYFDFSSPFAYLGAAQAEALAARTGAELRVRPMLLGALFRAIGTSDVPMMTWSDAKRRHTLADLGRWAAHLGVPFAFPSRFPIHTVKALRVYLALPEARRRGFRDATFRAYWGEGKDISDDAVLAPLVGEGAEAVLSRAATQEIKDALFESTKRAIDAGVFGAPTWVVDERDLFWGQDRVPLVERALLGATQ